MSVSIIIISHHEIGHAMLNTAKITFGEELPLSASTVDVQPDTNPETLINELQRLIKSLDHGEGVLIVTDMYGATPSNIAQQLHDDGNVRIITGLNLPMLIRVMNYPQLSLDELAEKAVEGGQSGIIQCQPQPKSNHDKQDD